MDCCCLKRFELIILLIVMNFQNTETQFLFRLNPLDIIDGKLQEIQTKASLNLDQVMEIFYEISSVQLRPGI